MLKERRKNKPIMQPVCDLTVDSIVEGSQNCKEMLEELINEQFQDIFSSDDENPFELDFRRLA